MINYSEINAGHIFSEMSYYRVEKVNKDNVQFTQMTDGKSVTLDKSYIEPYLVPADQFTNEVVVGKEDKFWTAKQIADAVKKGEIKDGTVNPGDLRTKGIRTLWEEIGNEVFTVCFIKQAKKLSKKDYEAKLNEKIEELAKGIDETKRKKKSVTEAAKLAIREALETPMLQELPGEDRVLVGHKLDFVSRDGYYNCVDLWLVGQESNTTRPVNINTIKWLVHKGTRYIVQ